jgi:peptidoglycan/xylan/chitin deacetylase (PgdA/CDA1 family)
MIRVALRFDDPSVTSNAALEEAIFKALERSGVPMTTAVIPFQWIGQQRIALDAMRAAHLIQAVKAGTIEIAMHGNCHETLPNCKSDTEFYGLPAAEQKTKLEEGLRQLHEVFGKVIGGFVPPFNSYDGTTAECVAGLGLHYISAGWDKSVAEGLVFLPRTCQFYELEGAIAEARSFPQLAPVVIPVLHQYDFRESGQSGARLDLASFEERLRWLAEQRDVQTLTLGALAAQISPAASCAALRRHQYFAQLHWRIQSCLPRHGMTTAGWPRLIFNMLLKRL